MATESNKLTFSYRDEFRRKSIAEKTIKLLKSDLPISPLIIDGDWGVGKTEFCYKLINLFNEQAPDSGSKDEITYHTVYIDAFKADHADEPLATILAAILNSLPDSDNKIEFRKKAMNVLKFGTSVISKAAVGILLRQDVAGIPDEFDQAFKEIIDKSIDSVLKKHEQAEEEITALKAVLKGITERDQLIIFIDELDRCRPDFTIKILENIKHIFDVDGVQFVLVANSIQIQASIEHSYGGVDAKRYLDKFIGYSFNLPSVVYKKQQGINNSIVHFQNLLNSNELLKQTDLSKVGYEFFFKKLIFTNNLSLREVETFIKYLMIYQTLSGYGLMNNSTFGEIMLRIFGVFIFCFKPKIVNELKRGVINKESLNKIIGTNPEFDFDKEVKGNIHLDLISLVITLGTYNQAQLTELNKDDQTAYWRHELFQFLGDWYSRNNKSAFDYIIEAIDEMRFGIDYDN